MNAHRLVVFAFVAAAPFALGCQPLLDSSASSASIWSISASSQSLSASSATTGVAPRFVADVVQLGHVAAQQDAAPSELLRALGDLALGHGVADWELLDASYLALGEGLRQGGLDPTGVAAFARRTFPDDARAQQLVARGAAS